MERGMGGRIEDAFASAKSSGEAAFITFVTAGYPRAQGKYFYTYVICKMPH
jgi:tryptophan synthase alpha subunit